MTVEQVVLGVAIVVAFTLAGVVLSRLSPPACPPHSWADDDENAQLVCERCGVRIDQWVDG